MTVEHRFSSRLAVLDVSQKSPVVEPDPLGGGWRQGRTPGCVGSVHGVRVYTEQTPGRDPGETHRPVTIPMRRPSSKKRQLTASSKTYDFELYWELQLCQVHFLGQAATGCTARPHCRLAVLQLLAIVHYYSSLCLARQHSVARCTPSNCRF